MFRVPLNVHCFKVAMHPEAIRRLIIIFPDILIIKVGRKITKTEASNGCRAYHKVPSPWNIQSLENNDWVTKPILKIQLRIADFFMPETPFFFELYVPKQSSGKRVYRLQAKQQSMHSRSAPSVRSKSRSTNGRLNRPLHPQAIHPQSHRPDWSQWKPWSWQTKTE